MNAEPGGIGAAGGCPAALREYRERGDQRDGAHIFGDEMSVRAGRCLVIVIAFAYYRRIPVGMASLFGATTRMLRHVLPFAVLVLGTFAGCTGSEFTTGSGVGGTGGSGGTTDGSVGDVLGDTVRPGDGPGDRVVPADVTHPPDGSAACDMLPSNAPDVYVDQRFKGASPNGTQTCPFQTIIDVIGVPIDPGVTRTIHVAGASPALVYDEPARVLVNSGITLLGDGPDKVTISASGQCAGLTCAVHVMSGGAIDGVTVTSPTGNGIVTGGVKPSYPPAAVRQVVVRDSAANGIVALGAVDLGPAIVVSHNGGTVGGHGVAADGPGQVYVHAGGQGVNKFDNNSAHGINVGSGAWLVFEGGEATGNGNNGIHFDQKSAPPPTVNSISGLVANGNSNYGIAVYFGSLTLRYSILLGNTNGGLYFEYPNGAQLDLGTYSDPGMNTFGSAVAASRDGIAGIFICCTATNWVFVSAVGNLWSSCYPPILSMQACSMMPNSYSDIVTAPPSTVGLDTSNCTVAP